MPALAIAGVVLPAAPVAAAHAVGVHPVLASGAARPADPCPSGEAPPCGATAVDKQEALTDKKTAATERPTADQKIADYNKQATKCKPSALPPAGETPTDNCLTGLLGDPGRYLGTPDRVASMSNQQTTLQNFRQQPNQNATAVVNTTCEQFGASLPEVKPENVNMYTALCKESVR
ncbi:hypothetical protein ACODT5_02010 [Streptomyces sp. 5.8]|uniref:hypothetical protein n=1 Tax=Streptomyces sp. 5.8 TaxID=3406571 RepID=UPI003BB6E304